jgi:hypothetical protein
MMTKKHYEHSEEVRVALLEQSIEYIHEALTDIKDSLKLLNSKIDSQGASLNSRMIDMERHLSKGIDLNFKWIIGFMVPSFVGILGLIAHAFKWI